MREILIKGPRETKREFKLSVKTRMIDLYIYHYEKMDHAKVRKDLGSLNYHRGAYDALKSLTDELFYQDKDLT